MNCLQCDSNEVDDTGYNNQSNAILWNCRWCDFVWCIEKESPSYYCKAHTSQLIYVPKGALLIASSKEIE